MVRLRFCIANPLFLLALWPLFHYLLWQDVATEYASADEFWPTYQAANLAFAQRIEEVYQPGDLIWVHDYHLLLVPKLVRQLIPEAVIGLFVHTPFPSSEVFRCLPSRYLPSFGNDLALIGLYLCRAPGDLGRHARCQPSLFPSTEIFISQVSDADLFIT